MKRGSEGLSLGFGIYLSYNQLILGKMGRVKLDVIYRLTLLEAIHLS